jgi:hypothetical protein
VFVVAPTEDPAFPGVNPIERSAIDVAPDGELPPVLVGRFKVDAAKIAARAHVLFPFVSPGLALEHFFPTLRPERQSLPNPFGAARQQQPNRGTLAPLLLSDTQLETRVDKSWSRHERWKGFDSIRVLIATHHADEGRLPALLRKYCDENALQPYVDTTRRDPRLWVQLGIASDHIEFIGFIRRYASEHTSTKSATELLFLLDALVQASRDTLGVLLDSEPATQLLWTRETDANAYELIRRIRQHYVRELNARGLTSKMAIDRHYDAVRMAILNGIIASARDGYRANDARFLLGVIHWRARRPAAALESWRALTEGSDGSHSAVSSQIRRLLLERPADDGVMRREVERILRNEQGRWLMSAYDRLEHFGYRVDTY